MSSQNSAAGGNVWRRVGFSAAALMLVGLCAAGCTTDGQPTLASGMRGATVAFESIDGLPEGLFRKLVQNLSAESEARQLAVVTREGPAQYRIRGYASAHVKAKRTTIAWVWDVYDSEQQRAVRISGEEQAAGARKGWTAADDQTLRRIARDGMDQLSAFLGAPPAQPVAPAPGSPDRGYTVAARDDFSPESSGIYRAFSALGPVSANAAPADPEATSANLADEAVPLPKRRPRNAGLTSQASLVQ